MAHNAPLGRCACGKKTHAKHRAGSELSDFSGYVIFSMKQLERFERAFSQAHKGYCNQLKIS
jgi:hypothetical protein